MMMVTEKKNPVTTTNDSSEKETEGLLFVQYHPSDEQKADDNFIIAPFDSYKVDMTNKKVYSLIPCMGEGDHYYVFDQEPDECITYEFLMDKLITSEAVGVDKENLNKGLILDKRGYHWNDVWVDKGDLEVSFQRHKQAYRESNNRKKRKREESATDEKQRGVLDL